MLVSLDRSITLKYPFELTLVVLELHWKIGWTKFIGQPQVTYWYCIHPDLT
ncbi:hypothetical protein DSUL_50332 [Desulfovibrionales bacterium]